jgi:hypothetical protein
VSAERTLDDADRVAYWTFSTGLAAQMQHEPWGTLVALAAGG